MNSTFIPSCLSSYEFKHKTIFDNLISITPDDKKSAVIRALDANFTSARKRSFVKLYSWTNLVRLSFIRKSLFKLNSFIFQILSLNPVLGNIYFHLFKPEIIPIKNILSSDNNNLDRIFNFHGAKFVATWIYEKGTGSTIFHIYNYGDLIVAPIYQGSLNSLSGILIKSSKENICFFLYTFKLGKTLNAVNSTELYSFVNQILERIVSPILPPSELSLSLYIGGKINFGHTLINDSSILDFNFINCIRKQIQIIVGNYDYFSFYKIIHKNTSTLFSDLKYFSINQFKISEKSYFLPNQIVLPIPARRPTTNSLDYFHKVLRPNPNHPIANNPTKPRAIYLLLDERTGVRHVKNWPSVASALSDYCKSEDITQIILDGYMSHSKYLDSLDEEYLETGSYLSVDFLSQIVDLLNDDIISLISLDALTIFEKLSICSQFEFVGAVSAYGSGMAFPIYLLNCPIVLFGADILPANIFKKWRWHYTLFCHSKRFKSEYHVKSFNISDDGFCVSIPDFMSNLNLF